MHSGIRPVTRRLAIVTLFFSATLALAQTPNKKILKHSDYEVWNKNSVVNMSRDGKWIAYTITPPEGDSQVVIRNLGSDLEHRLAQGNRNSAADGENTEAGTTPAGPPTVPGPLAGRGFRGLAGSGSESAQFTPDSKRVLFTHLPTRSEIEQARADKKGPAESPRPYLAIVDLPEGKIGQKIERVASYRIFGDGSGLLAYRKENRPTMSGGASTGGAPGAGTAPAAPTGPQPPGGPGGIRTRGPRGTGPGGPGAGPGGPGAPGGAGPGTTAPRVVYGTDLIIRKLSDGSERTIADVMDYLITKDGRELVYSVASRKEETNGVYVVDLNSQAAPFAIQSGKGRYTRLTWDDREARLAFFYDDTPTPTPPPTPPTPASASPMSSAAPMTPTSTEAPRSPARIKIFVWDRNPRTQLAAAPMGGAASTLATARAAFQPSKELLGPTSAGLPAGMLISDRGTLSFSADGNKLSFGLMPIPTEPTRPSTPTTTPASPAGRAAAAPEKVDLDLWHWKDELIQPMQKVRGGTDRQRNQSAVYFFDTRAIRPLGNENRTVFAPNHGDWTVVANDKPYRHLTGY